MAQIDVEERFGDINGLRFDNLVAPGETINEFRKRATIGAECLGGFTGVVEMCYRKIAREGAIKRRKRIHMIPNRGEHCIRGDESALCRCNLPIRCADFNPTAHCLNRLWRKRFAAQRHPLVCRQIRQQSAIKCRCTRVSWDNGAGCQQRGVFNCENFREDAVFTVAGDAVLLKDSGRLLCEGLLRIRAPDKS